MRMEAILGSSPARYGRGNLGTIGHLRLALRTAQSPLDFVFHLGYQQFVFPRWFRRVFAKGRVHRAWMDGYHGWWLGKIVDRQ